MHICMAFAYLHQDTYLQGLGLEGYLFLPFLPCFRYLLIPAKIFKIESDRHANTRISSPIVVRITVVVHIARVRSVAAIHR